MPKVKGRIDHMDVDVDRQSLQPSREVRFAAKRVNFAEQQQESLLRQIFWFGRVCYHAQAYRVHASAMQAIEVFKRSSIAFARSLNDLHFAPPIASYRRDMWRSHFRHAFTPESVSQTRLPRFFSVGLARDPI